MSSFVVVNAQEKKSIDTVKTEIVTIITTYNPKIADASKIKRTPELTLSEKSKKRKLQYPIYSVPVASTFMPKTGTPKSVDLGKRDRIYKNYIAAGYGQLKCLDFIFESETDTLDSCKLEERMGDFSEEVKRHIENKKEEWKWIVERNRNIKG